MNEAIKVGYLFGEIDDKMAEKTCRAINSGEVDALWINSIGGDIEGALAIADAIRQHQLTTIGTGEVSSAAVVVLCAGKYRYATPHTAFCVHPPSGGNLLSLPLKAALAADLISGSIGMPVDEVFKTLFSAEEWMGVTRARQLGIIQDYWPPALIREAA